MNLLRLLLVGVSLVGCTSSFKVLSSPEQGDISFAEFNAIAKDEDALLVFVGDSTRKVHGVQCGTSWIHGQDLVTHKKFTLQTWRIRKVLLTGRARGSVEGAAIGLAAGVAGGFVAGAVLVPRPDDSFGRLFAYVLLPGIGAGAGIVTGTIVGLIAGHVWEYYPENDFELPALDFHN